MVKGVISISVDADVVAMLRARDENISGLCNDFLTSYAKRDKENQEDIETILEVAKAELSKSKKATAEKESAVRRIEAKRAAIHTKEHDDFIESENQRARAWRLHRDE